MQEVENLKGWFYLNRRSLPWRENPSPYEVWVSEVMLQQTQVTVVVPYFRKWMTLFPTIRNLAEAPEKKVIKCWEGLGYYSRARALHQGARYLVENHEGELPDTYQALEKVKGLGPYTIGAILSFAYKQREAAVDGNVLRVLSRYYGIEEEIDRGKVQKEIRSLCQGLLPKEEPWIIMEGLIELGALVCQKKAKCGECPLRRGCVAYNESKADLLPRKRPRQKTIHLHRSVAVVQSERSLLIREGEVGKVMHGLAEFPYFDQGVEVEKALGLPLEWVCSLPKLTHGFTKYKAFLTPELYQTKEVEVEGYNWVTFEEIFSLPFSSGHRQILLHLKKYLPIS